MASWNTGLAAPGHVESSQTASPALAGRFLTNGPPGNSSIFFPLYSSWLFMTFETVFRLETAAPLALWCEILVLLFFSWMLLAALGAPHPLCLMIITSFVFFFLTFIGV